ncbi:MAG: hypothetical protein F9K40_11095, partial [Kofleriaceae bacterium]
MRKLTVLSLLSLSLTTACMSEASWPHRDRAGFPMSTWSYRDHACSEVRRASDVSPESMSQRQRALAARCGYGLGAHWKSGVTYPPPPTPTHV